MSLEKNSIIVNCIDDRLAISFKYINESCKINREFNFNRNPEEKIDSFLEKISAKLKDIYTKKNKKNKLPELDFPVSLINKCNNEVICVKTATESQHKDPRNCQNNPQTTNIEEKASTPVESSYLSCSHYFVDNAENHTVSIGQDIYSIDLNPPLVTNIKLPKTCMVGYSVYPTTLELTNATQEACGIEWFKSKQKFENISMQKGRLLDWDMCGKGLIFNPTEEDLGKFIKVRITPKHENRVGVTSEAVTPSYVEAGPGTCPFHRRHRHTLERTDRGEFRVVSYNILADIFSKTNTAKEILFPSCPPHALMMEYRKPLLIKEITGYNADLICLQEVDKKIYVKDLSPILTTLGYAGEHAGKSDENSEGCCIFYNKEKFSLLESMRYSLTEQLQENIIFYELWEKIQTSEPLADFMKNRKNILQVFVLKSCEDPSHIVIAATTHLYFRPLSDDVRLMQGWISINLLQQISQLYQSKFPDSRVGIVFSGDFNTVPENAVYRLYTSQFVSDNDADWNSDPNHQMEGMTLSHSLEVDSAYKNLPYTNYTCNFNGCLDYIFYQCDQFSVKKTVPIPTHEEITENVALPSIKFPSDHVALVADLTWNSKS